MIKNATDFRWIHNIGVADRTDVFGLGELPYKFDVVGKSVTITFTFKTVIYDNPHSEDAEIVGHRFVSNCDRFLIRIYND